MPDYEEKMLTLLAEGYRNSKKDSGTNRIHRRTQISPLKLYKAYNQNDGDMEQIDAVNNAAAAGREKGFLTFSMNGFSNEISAIYLVDEKIDEVEAYLRERYGYESKHDKQRLVEQIIGRYRGRSPVADRECARLRAILDKNRVPKDFLQAEEILKALVFIENNREPLYIREASMLIYGESKYLENNTLEPVCRLLRAYWKRPCSEDELPDEILQEYNIRRERQKICLKGDITIQKEGRKMELGVCEGGAELYTDDLEQIGQVTVHAACLITVENRTSYLRCQAKNTAFFYLGGYANRYQRDLLKKIHRDNPGLMFFHFGDIDAGGFYIHEHLCRVTGISFALFCMSVKQLQDERYKNCMRKLTEHDRERLKSLADHDLYRDVAEYMLEYDVKLEQEIVSFYGICP